MEGEPDAATITFKLCSGRNSARITSVDTFQLLSPLLNADSFNSFLFCFSCSKNYSLSLRIYFIVPCTFGAVESSSSAPVKEVN